MSTFYAKSHLRRCIGPSTDFSAMSALGLVLVNFFMLQQLWEKPQVLPLVLPLKHRICYDCDVYVQNGKVFTLLCAREKVYTYAGYMEPALDSTDHSAHGLRQLILRQKQKVDDQYGPDEYTERRSGASKKGSYLQVVIKPLASASYGNVVDVLDEMNICRIRYYFLLDPRPDEIEMVRVPGKKWVPFF